ncbi:unnamed protein product [Mesocestoides corti]|uniref:SCP domain-containing protein n=1 Tax=Mesocestoides corti TaxID=53468 RepID=A0A0R3U7G0_MESCO|nr:unnamed protein product [Mesocestoides corti]
MSLEKLAIDWVQRCLLERPNPNLYPQYRGTGQAISVVVDDNPNLVDIVQGWYEEGKNYVFKNNTCEGICDDYIQEYSLSLEKLAVDWVKLCRFEYPNLNIYPKYRGVGQLLTLIGGSKPELVDAAHTWYDQGKTYHFANNTCEDYCGGYLQMVWAKSVRLGCAMMRCDHVKPSWSKPVYIVTCLYRPGRNSREKRPYIAGPSCSQCPREYECHGKQCVMNPDAELIELGDNGRPRR